MKRDDFDLRNAFSPEPEACRAALMDAARSVREDEPMKRYTIRTVLIAALIIAAMMAVAVAAMQSGLMTWFSEHYKTALPASAQEVLSTTEKSTFETGPAVVTINELLCDGKIAYLTAEIQPNKEGSAIFYPGSGDPYDWIGKIAAARFNHPQISAKTSYLEAAQILNKPLYAASAWMEIEASFLTDFEMMDALVFENGNLLLIHMLYLTEPYAGRELPVQVSVRLSELDKETLEYVVNKCWEASEERILPIHGVTAEKHYKPVSSTLLHDRFRLTGVTARQTCAGVYIHIYMEPSQNTTLKELFLEGFEWNVLDENGMPYPTGISLSAELLNADGDPFPYEVPYDEVELGTFQYMMMISADELPETLIVTDDTNQITVR